MEPVAARLSELLGRDVVMAKDVVGEDAKAKAAAEAKKAAEEAKKEVVNK